MKQEDYLREQIKLGLVYVRCVQDWCSEGYVYVSKSGSSLNAELVKKGFAFPTENAAYDVAELKGNLKKFLSPKIEPSESKQETSSDKSSQSNSTESPKSTPGSSSSTSTPGTDVQVKGYYRKDGTYVRPHTRSAPGSKKRP
jgi:hypothetical protein